MDEPRRSARVEVSMSRGAESWRYMLVPVRPDALQRDEARAWLMRKTGPAAQQEKVYRLSCHVNALTACTCDGFRKHQHCKHEEWARAWGLFPSAEEGVHVAQAEAELLSLSGAVEDLQRERSEMGREIAKYRGWYEAQQEEAHRLRACLALTLQELDQEQARARELSASIEACIRTDEAHEPAAAPVGQVVAEEAEAEDLHQVEADDPAEPRESAQWTRRGCVPLLVIVRGVNDVTQT